MKGGRPERRACAAVVVFALAACQGPPARLIASIADTVVVNDVRPMQMPMHVFDAAGHVLPDTGVRFQWTSGAPIPVSSRGVVTCTHAGDATLRASLGPLVTQVLVLCRPVHDVFGGGVLNLVLGDSSQVLSFAPVDAAGRPVRLFTLGINYDSAIVSLEGWRIQARASGRTSVDLYIGDTWTHWFVSVYERASTVENPARAGPDGTGASSRWRDAQFAASAIATDLLCDDASRPRYSAGATARHARSKLRRWFDDLETQLLVLRAAGRNGRSLPPERGPFE